VSTNVAIYAPGPVPQKLDDSFLRWTHAELHRIAGNLRQLGEGGGGGVTVHNSLTGRDVADAHPISAVTGLQAALDGKEASLGNPVVDGYLLSSTAAGARSWVAPPAGVTDHGLLTGLSDPDHPIAAISGLQTELDKIPDWNVAYRGASSGQSLGSLTTTSQQLLFTTAFNSISDSVSVTTDRLTFLEAGSYLVFCDLSLACSSAPNNFTINFQIRSGSGAVVHTRDFQVTFSVTRLSLFTLWPENRAVNDQYRFWLTGNASFTLLNVVSNLKVAVVKVG
jgi:hypothetical protein